MLAYALAGYPFTELLDSGAELLVLLLGGVVVLSFGVVVLFVGLLLSKEVWT